MNSRKLKLFIFSVGILAVTAACKSYSKTTVTSEITGPTVIQKPVIADLDVKEERVSGTASDRRSTPVIELKQAALNDAITKSKADVLVEPRYEIITDKKKTTVNVTGYPATYKNFRPMEAQDTIYVDKTRLKTSSTRKRTTKQNNGRRNKIIGYTVGGVAAAVGIFFLTIFLL